VDTKELEALNLLLYSSVGGVLGPPAIKNIDENFLGR
jgi:hypothetical protein